MSADTKIQWCDATFNPWIGCSKVAAGCTNCYAETSTPVRRGMGTWGRDGARHVTSDTYWRQPLAWNRRAEREGRRLRVFCASLADVFEDRDDLVEPRIRLFDLVRETPELDWQLLTKRPENVGRLWNPLRLPGHESLPGNVWLGVSVATQEDVDENLPELARIPAVVRFVSAEPLIEPIDLYLEHNPPGIRPDWVIVGGESGPRARPCDVAWVRSIVRQCKAAGVACFVKQFGSNPTGDWCPPGDHEPCRGGVAIEKALFKDPKGGDPSEWPEDLRVREFPEVVWA